MKSGALPSAEPEPICPPLAVPPVWTHRRNANGETVVEWTLLGMVRRDADSDAD